MEIVGKVLLDAVRAIFFTIDSVVYGFIPIIYKLIISLANVDLYSNNPAIASLLNRVYVIVGIFMLFKLAFSILRYIVDPSAFSDSAKGFTGLVRRIMIAIILLVSVPFLFSKIYEYQGIILNSNILPNLILGSDERTSTDMGDAAVDLQFMIFGPFFTVNTNSDELKACASEPNNKPLSNIIGSTDMATKDGCLEAFNDAMKANSNVQAAGVTLDNFFKADGYTRNFSKLGALLTWSDSNGEYVINYMFIISTICGGYLVFLLLSFCVDIASRAIKLMFLQLLSPVAIITSVDPTSSSQNDKLKDWGMECFKTYVSLFLRLIVIYAVIQMIKMVTAKLFAGTDSLYYSGFASKADSSLNIWIYIFLVLGAFAVAKKIPELIEKAFGIKMSGEINMNPFKTFRENIGASLVGVGAAAIGGGLVNTAVSGYNAFNRSLNEDNGHGGLWAAGSAIRHGLGSGIAGTASVLNRGVRGAMRGDRGFKNMRNAYGSAMFARQQREDLHRQGVSYADMYKADLQRNLGIFTAAQQQQLDYDRDEKALNALKNSREEMAQPFEDYKNIISGIDGMMENHKMVSDAKKELELLKASNADETRIRAAQAAVDDAKKQAYHKMIADTSDSNHQLMVENIRQLDQLRKRNSSLQHARFDFEDASGDFSKGGMYWASNESAQIKNASITSDEIDRFGVPSSYENYTTSEAERELASRKSSPQWAINEKANSASKVNSPQPEGWMPTGEIQGQYRDTFGPSGWGGGPGGPRPGGPGPGPRP